MPASADRFFLDIQDAAARILDADAAFDGVPILTEELGDLDNAIGIVMGKLGICAIIETPFASITAPNTPPVHFNDVPITVTIWEDTFLNRPSSDVNQRHWVELALIALYLLLHSTPRDESGEQVATAFHADNPTLIDLRNEIDREKFPNIQGVQLRLKCTTGFTYTPQAPLLDGNNQQLLDGLGLKITTDRPFSRA